MGRRPIRRFQINVTEADIANGLRNNSYHCAVSQAIARELPDAKFISTDIQTIRFSLAESGERLTYLTPPNVQQYIVAFDAGDVLKPFGFYLYTPAWVAPRWPTRVGSNTPHNHPKETALINTGKGVVETNRRMPNQLRTSGRRVYGMRALRINQTE